MLSYPTTCAMIKTRPVSWLKAARKDFERFPEGAQVEMARALTVVAEGGFPDIALMEDIAFAHRLKRISRPLSLRACVTTSGRRWETRGVLRMIVLMWRLRLAYFFGAKPEQLARRYGYAPSDPPRRTERKRQTCCPSGADLTFATHPAARSRSEGQIQSSTST